MSEVSQCPVCGASVVACDNAVLLDYPAVRNGMPGADWWIMRVGPMSLAAAGGPDHATHELAHTLHEHQPQETDEDV